MADEVVCGGRTNIDNDGSDVPALACYVEDRGMVSKHGFLGLDRTFLRYGYLPLNSLLRNGLHGTTWSMALSEFVRGCGIL